MLAAGGLLAFTAETHEGEGVILGEGLRYAHGAAYVRASVEAAGLEVVAAGRSLGPQRGQRAGAGPGRGRRRKLEFRRYDFRLAEMRMLPGGIAPRRDSSLLPRLRECRSCAHPGRNNNEEQTDAARIRRHRACHHRSPPPCPRPSSGPRRKKYDAGASDTEIKLGQTVPHSGPGSLYGVLGRVGEAYFQMLNEKGGINGRKIKFLTMDDAYSAPKCVEATRRLVEQEEVLALFGSLGTAPQTAVHKYLNSKGVPQLLLNTGASKWNDPKNNKWTMAGLPLYPTEARILAKHVVQREAECARSASSTRTTISAATSSAPSRRCWRMPAAPPR